MKIDWYELLENILLSIAFGLSIYWIIKYRKKGE